MWWRRQNQESKSKFLEFLKRHRLKLAAAVALYFSAIGVYWYSHLEKTPITGRTRFMAFGPEQRRTFPYLDDLDELLEDEGNTILPETSPEHKLVTSIVNRIVASNSQTINEIAPGLNFSVIIIDAPGLSNALVAPDGRVVVSTDFFTQVKTDDELAIVIGHEISHAILEHTAETISEAYLIGFITSIFLVLIWALFPLDVYSALLTYFGRKASNLVHNYPHSRKLESEADQVGLELAARACYDIRQAVVLWKRFDEMEKKGSLFTLAKGTEVPKAFEYFSTHPSHHTRWRTLIKLQDEALSIRDQCYCPKLP